MKPDTGGKFVGWALERSHVRRVGFSPVEASRHALAIVAFELDNTRQEIERTREPSIPLRARYEVLSESAWNLNRFIRERTYFIPFPS